MLPSFSKQFRKYLAFYIVYGNVEIHLCYSCDCFVVFYEIECSGMRWVRLTILYIFLLVKCSTFKLKSKLKNDFLRVTI